MNKMADKQEVPCAIRIKVVCKFCNAIIGCEKGNTDLFCQHLEESHNIFNNQDMVLAVQFLSETQRSELLKMTRGAIREKLHVRQYEKYQKHELVLGSIVWCFL